MLRASNSLFVKMPKLIRIPAFLLPGLLMASIAYSQRDRSSIIDDSTRQVYGPETSRYTLEGELFYNRLGYQGIDTAILNLHRWHYLPRHEYRYQDLGNIGTALRPINVSPHQTAGVSTGFSSYSPYWEQEEIRIYNTRSPFSTMSVVWGGNGRANTRAEFSRNITPTWNFGFNYRGLLVDKQIQRQGKGDRQVIGNYYDVFTHYTDKKDHYMAFFSFRRMRHKVNEYGGVYASEPNPPFESYFSPNAQPTLTAAVSEDWRINFHLFHQYKLGKGLQVYHKADQDKQRNVFDDDLLEERDNYFDFTQKVDTVDSLMTHDKTRFTFFKNEFGIKGGTKHFFYNGYYKIRLFKTEYKYINPDTLGFDTEGVENSLGGAIRLQLDSLNFLSADLEVLQSGQYRASATLRSKWLEAEVSQTQAKPSFLALAYRGHHDEWVNRFDDENTTYISAFARMDTRYFSGKGGLQYRDLGNHIYFRKDSYAGTAQTVLPLQSSGRQRLLSPEFSLRVTFLKSFIFRANVVYNKLLQNDDGALEVPDLMVNTQLYYHGFLWRRNLEVNLGTETHWQSDYFAFGYDPVIQQYYRQDEVQVAGYPIIDAYLDSKIKWARFFVRYHNILQLFRQTGYLSTPGYPGQKNILDFGFDFTFYD